MDLLYALVRRCFRPTSAVVVVSEPDHLPPAACCGGLELVSRRHDRARRLEEVEALGRSGGESGRQAAGATTEKEPVDRRDPDEETPPPPLEPGRAKPEK